MSGVATDRAYTFGSGQVPAQALNRMADDEVLNAEDRARLWGDHHLPQVHTSDYKMPFVAAADQVTLADEVEYTVGGLTFNTTDLANRTVAVPDMSTRYIYLEPAADCGEVVTADPPADWTRKLTATLSASDVEVLSTPDKMLVLKAVKGASGEVPAVTAYRNYGHEAVLAQLPVTALGEVHQDESAQADQLVINPSAEWTEYTDRQPVLIRAANTNTGSTTLNISGVGPKPVKTLDDQALGAKAFLAGQTLLLIYSAAAGGGSGAWIIFSATAAGVYLDQTNLGFGENTVQAQLEASQKLLTDTGTANAYVISPAIARAAYKTGQSYLVKIGAGNTNTSTSCTLNVSGKGAAPIKMDDGTNPAVGTIKGGGIYKFYYDGNNMVILSHVPPIQAASAAVTVLTNGQADTWTAVDCSAAIPAGARFVFLCPNVNGTAPTLVRANGTTMTFGMVGPGSDYPSSCVCPCSPEGIIDYVRAEGTGRCDVDVVGSIL